MATASKSLVILHTKEDWDPWIELIKTSALKHDVWKFVDPTIQEQELPKLLEPSRPKPNMVKRATTARPIIYLDDLSAAEKDEYISLKEDYTRSVRRWDKQEEALGELRIKIQESIHITNITFTYDCEGPYQMLRNLSNHFSPTDEIRKQELLIEWRELQRKWTKGTDVSDWLHKWEYIYNKMLLHKMPDIEGIRPVLDFLNVVNTLDASFASSWQMKIAMGETATFPEVLTTFRNYRRAASTMLKSQPIHGAFPTLNSHNEDGTPSNTSNSTSTQGINTIKCPCGYLHIGTGIRGCWYLIPASRPANWVPNSEREKKVAHRLATDKAFKAKVEEWKKTWKPAPSRSQEQGKPQRSSTPPVVAMASQVRMSTFGPVAQAPEGSSSESMEVENGQVYQVSSHESDTKYELHDSDILDSGASLHVCNDKSRFLEYAPASSENDILWSGNVKIPIQGYGVIQLVLRSPKYPNGRVLTLKNVAYVPTLHTTVVSLRLLIKAGIHWDTKRSILTYEGRHFGDTPMKFDQWVLQYTPVETTRHQSFIIHGDKDSLSTKSKNNLIHSNSSRAPRVQKGTYDEWHIRMGHLYHDALLKLPQVTKGCEMTTSKPAIQVCEVCRLANAKRIISRVPRTRASRPFWRISWDLIQMNEGKNNEKYVMHFLCDCSRMNFVYLLPNKKQDTLMNTFIAFAEYIKRRWGFDIVVWKGDGEKSLGAWWIVWVNSKGYEVETSAPETQAQNGDAERSGGVLQLMGTKLKGQFNVPDMLWSEIFATAGYILNRSPTRSLGMKTPLGYLKEYLGETNPEPSTAHLRPYGCKAYALIKNRPKLDKLQPRAEIGFLVGYESTNIFRICIPSRNFIVISTRDVTFDPSQGYSPSMHYDKITDEILEILQVPAIELQNSIDELDIEQIRESIGSGKAIQDTSSSSSIAKNLEIQEPEGLPTPEATPEPSQHQYQASEEAPSSPNQVQEEVDQQLLGTSSNEGVSKDKEVPIRKEFKGYITDITEEDSKAKSEIYGNPEDPRNIIEGKRDQKKKVHFELHKGLNQEAPFHTAFLQGMKHGKERLKEKDFPPPPENWYQLKYHTHSEGFKAAAVVEFDTLKSQQTFEEIQEKTATTKPIPVKWVFTYKFDDNGYFIKYKARMVIRGDLQLPTDKDTYAATLSIRVCRAILAIAAYFDLECNQFDVTNAFPHAELALDDEIFIQYPDGFKSSGQCLRVLRALYGLTGSPRLWYNHLVKALEKFGLKQVPESHCVFSNDKLIVSFYVDDITAYYHMRNGDYYGEFRKMLFETFTIRDLGEIKWFLGLRIIRDRVVRRMWLVQDSYIEKVARNFDRIDTHGILKKAAASTPMFSEDTPIWDGTATDHEIHEFQRRVGSLTYAAVISRPDIAKATQRLSEIQRNPGPRHFEAANRVIDYLYNTRYLALEYGMITNQGPVFIAASDASYGDNIPGRQSSESKIFKLFGGVIDYSANKQSTVTKSSTESELLALSHICAWLYWWYRFFFNLSLDLEQDPTVWCDNLQTVRLMLKESPKLVTKLKHVDIHQHWLRQEAQKGAIKIEWIETALMPADGLTKGLSHQKHQTFLKQLNMVDVKSKIIT